MVHDDGYVLICKKCYSNYKIPCEHDACDERFKDKDEEKEHRQESCNRCSGHGWIMTSYTPATYHDPADADGEDCDECGGEGRVCEGFNAESFSAERPHTEARLRPCVKCNATGRLELDEPYFPVGSIHPQYTIDCDECLNGVYEDTSIPYSDKDYRPFDAESFSVQKACHRCGNTEKDGKLWWVGSRKGFICSDCSDGGTKYLAESNELEESKKRTKMSAIRTGLAITTFGIVMWNLWTNKKQEKDIADIMDLV